MIDDFVIFYTSSEQVYRQIPLLYSKFLFTFFSASPKSGGTPRRHEPLLHKHEPPRFARQTKPPLCSTEHAQYIKMCLCNTGGFLNLCFKFK